jgi:hypothetical protein
MNKSNKHSLLRIALLMTLIFISLVSIGCEQISNLKDNAVDKFNEWKESDFFQETSSSNTATITIAPTTTINSPITTTSKITVTTPKPTYNNPSWGELVFFLQDDKTDTNAYVYPTFVCADFANMLQVNAHKAGWRCGIVHLEMHGYTDPYQLGISSNAGHACNAFETTDRGLVFIDCTGLLSFTINRPLSCDKVVNVIKGQQFTPVSLFPEYGWNSTWEDMGIVDDYTISW